MTPPIIAVITPAMGGASLAMARPSPRGSAIRLTTNPENIFFGNVFTNPLNDGFFGLIVQLIRLLVVQLKYAQCRVEINGPKSSFFLGHSSPTSQPLPLEHNDQSSNRVSQK